MFIKRSSRYVIAAKEVSFFKLMSKIGSSSLRAQFRYKHLQVRLLFNRAKISGNCNCKSKYGGENSRSVHSFTTQI